MRSVVVASFTVIALTALPIAAQAAPTALSGLTTAAPTSQIIPIAGGCGPGWHPRSWRDRYGYWHRRCVPNYY